MLRISVGYTSGYARSTKTILRFNWLILLLMLILNLVVNDPAGIYRDFLLNMRDKTGFLCLLLLNCVLHEAHAIWCKYGH